jgi:hypothetical protein
MDYISILKDSIETSVTIKLFNTVEESTRAHIFNSQLIKLPMTIFKNVQNFNPNRLQKSAIKAYPLNDRPRGNKNISSVKFYQKQIKEKKNILPIWMAIKNGKYILLDGAHRIVASYMENKSNIDVYLIAIL